MMFLIKIIGFNIAINKMSLAFYEDKLHNTWPNKSSEYLCHESSLERALSAIFSVAFSNADFMCLSSNEYLIITLNDIYKVSVSLHSPYQSVLFDAVHSTLVKTINFNQCKTVLDIG